jgi:hypothetical protein
MNLDISGFRSFWHDVDHLSAEEMNSQELAAQIARLAPCMRSMEGCRDATHRPSIDEKWDWYALSRINDEFILPFQADSRHPWAGGPFIAITDYVAAFGQLGFTDSTPVIGERFLPHRHEIHGVKQSDHDDEPVTIARTVWPGLKYGALVFSRAGVVVRGGRRHVLKEIAENSTLYFQFRRLGRRTEDLSMGWGHNSQWRTSFRFDYETNGMVLYNVGGRNRLEEGAHSRHEDGCGNLTLPERIELCRNRCFLTVEKPHRDLFPYDDSYHERLETVGA